MKKPLKTAAFPFPREAQRDTLRKFRSGSPPEPFPQYRPHMPYIVALRLSGDMQSHPGRKHRCEKRYQCRIRNKYTPFPAHLFSAK